MRDTRQHPAALDPASGEPGGDFGVWLPLNSAPAGLKIGPLSHSWPYSGGVLTFTTPFGDLAGKGIGDGNVDVISGDPRLRSKKNPQKSGGGPFLGGKKKSKRRQLTPCFRKGSAGNCHWAKKKKSGGGLGGGKEKKKKGPPEQRKGHVGDDAEFLAQAEIPSMC